LVFPVPSPAPSPQRAPNSLPSESFGSTLSLEGFTSFLLSAENSPFTDHHARVWHDMTRPLSEYYISSSHNTYLVGHQLVGESTIEGYIRALLHSCRSVECEHCFCSFFLADLRDCSTTRSRRTKRRTS
jgi:phosphatidylinositol phospholipase C delta